MTGFARASIACIAMSVAASCYAATAGETPPPRTGATGDIQPAPPPAQPAVTPAGFPVLIVPVAIVIGIAAALGAQDNDAEFSTSTTTR